jgi:hypothetical protein
MRLTEVNKASRMPIENTIGKCDIFPQQLWFSQTVIQLIQLYMLYSVSFYHVCEYSSFITLEACIQQDMPWELLYWGTSCSSGRTWFSWFHWLCMLQAASVF